MTDRDIIYLGALLHDIGKFAWRAQELKEGDNHEKLGEEFIREHLGKCKAIAPKIEQIIDAANRKVGDVKRSDIEAAQERERQDSKQPRRPLVSVFNRVSIGKASLPARVGYYQPVKTGADIQMPEILEQSVTVEQWKPNEKEMIECHRTSWEQFLADVKRLRDIEDLTVFVRTFHSLLEEYTTTICSAGYLTYPDITLYDHSRITAALAACRSDSYLIIKGDVSGTQNFIYHSIRDQKSPAKKLRGRSFYLTLLVDTIAAFCIERLGLYPSNLLFNSGGHFQILAPNTKEVYEAIQDIERKTNEALLKRFNGTLSLVLAWVETSPASLMKEYNAVVERVQEELEVRKKKKFLSVAESVMLAPLDEEADENMEKVIEKIGKELPLSTHLLEVHYNTQVQREDFGDFFVDFREFSTAWVFVKDKDLSRGIVLGSLKEQDIRYALLHSIKSENFLEYTNQLQGLDYPLGFTRKYIGTHIPMNKENEPMEFKDLATIESEQYPLLGVVRMDVDSLGALFSIGLREENEEERKYTLSRLAVLSRELTKFFTLHVNTLAAKNTIYLVYSGGDDVFAVGSWVKILDFAQNVRDDFREFVCGNENLTISAGIVFTKDSFPISISAGWAGDQESKAKDVDPKKDKVSVFDRKVSWNQLKEMLEWGNQILKIVNNNEHNDNTLPRSFIHNVLTQTKQCFDENENLRPHKVERFSAWMHYVFARRKVNAEKIEENTENIKIKFAQHMLTGNKKERIDIYKNFIIPASYVLLKTRKL